MIAATGVIVAESELPDICAYDMCASDLCQDGGPHRFPHPRLPDQQHAGLAEACQPFSLRPPGANLRAGESLGNQRFEGVYLTGTEAIEAARVVLVSLLPRYNRARLFLKGARLEAAPPRLIYYPFHRNGLHLREVNSDHSIKHGTVPLTPCD